MPQPTPPAPPPDPRVVRAEKIANDTRVESALNDFIAAKQAALFDAPDAFYRTEGEDAIHAAPVTTRTLGQLRNDLLDGLGNDYQRRRLGNVLDAQMQLTRDGMARHVAEQSLAWQRGVAQDRIAILTKEAAHHHNDTDLVDALGHAAANAARAHARVGDPSASLRAGGPPGGQAEDAAAATARSGVLGAAIQARLDGGDTQGANALFTQAQSQLDPAHAAPLQAHIDTVQRLAAAKDYVRQLVPAWSDVSPEEIDVQHATATQQNQTDNAGDPELQTDVQHVLDVQHGLQKRGLDQVATPKPNPAVQEWLLQTGPDGQPQIERPPAAIWNTLGPEERAAVDRQLTANAHGEAADEGTTGHFEVVPGPSSIGWVPQPPPQQPSTEQPPTQQPPGQTPNPPQENGPDNAEPPPKDPEDGGTDPGPQAPDNPRWEDLGIWDKIRTVFERFELEGEARGATFGAASAGKRLQQIDELAKRKAAGEELNVTEERFLQKNRNAASELTGSVGRLVDAQKRIGELPRSAALRRLLEAPSLSDALHIARKSPGEIAAALGLESAPDAVAGLAAIAALGPVGGGAVLTGTAGAQGYASGLIGALSLEGVDLTDPEQLKRALRDNDLMQRVRARASTQAAIEAGTTLMMAIIGGRAGKVRAGSKGKVPDAQLKAYNAAFDARPNKTLYQTYKEAPITGLLRGTHRRQANLHLEKTLREDPEFANFLNRELKADALAHMRSGFFLRTPPGMTWHHPFEKEFKDFVHLLRVEEHTNSTLQSNLHPGGIGGYAKHYGPQIIARRLLRFLEEAKVSDQ